MTDLLRTEDASHRLPRILSELTASGICESDIPKLSAVMVPSFGLSGYEGPAFPSGTRDLLLFLRRNSQELRIVVASSGDRYRELSQHADLWLLPVFLVLQPNATELIVGLLSNYIYDRIIKPLLPGQNAEVESELLLKSDDKTVSMRYRGPAESFDRFASQVLEEVKGRGQGCSGTSSGEGGGA